MMKTKQKNALGVLLLLCFAGLALSVMAKAQWINNLDRSMRDLATSSTSPINTLIFKIVSFFGSPAVVIVLTMFLCCWLWFKRDLSICLCVGGLQLLGSAIVVVIKQFVARSRPIHQLITDTGYSFPSGHTFCTTILIFTFWMLFLPKIKDQEVQFITVLIGIIWIGMIAASRVYLRNHFASDVIASFFLASGYWLIVIPYTKVIQIKLRQFLPERILKLWTHKN